MAIKAMEIGQLSKAGRFYCPSVTGLYSITGVGFKPISLELTGVRTIGLGADFYLSHGFADIYGNQTAVAWTTKSKGNTYGGWLLDGCIYVLNSSGGIYVRANWVSMDTDGFTLNFTVITPDMFNIHWMVH